MRISTFALLGLFVNIASGNEVSYTPNRPGVKVQEAHSVSASPDCDDPSNYAPGTLCAASLLLGGAFHDTSNQDSDNAEFVETINIEVGNMAASLVANRVSDSHIHAEGAHGEELTAIKKDGKVSGSINAGGMICEWIGQEEEGDIEMDCTPESEYPPEDDHTQSDEEYRELRGSGRRAVSWMVNQLADPNDHSMAYFDVMVIYTQNAMCADSATSYPCLEVPNVSDKILARIDLAIEESNTALQLSQIDAEMRLVHAYLDPTVDDTGRSISSLLSDLRNGINGFEYVEEMRTLHGADFVALITNRNEFCGMAGLPVSGPQHTSVTSRTCATGYYSFAHEIGHNMGCFHNREQGTQSGNNYGYGYNGQINDSNGVRSILSYSPGTRVLRFSNPDIQYGDKVIGSAESNNARWIQERRHIFAAYRDASPTLSPVPTVSNAPTPRGTTLAPSISSAPSATPSKSAVPTASPSSSPSYTATTEARLKVRSPASDNFQIQNGNMFDLIAKENILIHNLEVTLYSSTVVTVELYTKTGTFINDIRNETAWTLSGSAPGMYGTGCLDDTMMMPRGSIETPIAVAAGSTIGMYLKVIGNNYIGMDNLGFNEDGNYGIYFENNDLAVTDGVYKSRWDHHSGSPYNSYRFAGYVYYTIDGTRSPTAAPSSRPSAPTASPSLGPSLMPSTSRVKLSSPNSNSFYIVPGVMFDVKASSWIEINNFDVNIYEQGPAVTIEIYTRLGSHVGVSTDMTQWEHVATIPDMWGSGDAHHDTYVTLPPGSFDPLEINAGQTRAFYLHVAGQLSAGNKLAISNGGTSYNCEAGHYFGDSSISVCGGLWKRDWNDDNGGGTSHYGFQGSVIYTELGTMPPSKASSESPTSSINPTKTPTTAPSKAPTKMPTTGAPVKSPSKAPTKTPTTDSPSKNPTNSPSKSPTTSPTAAPTPAPTAGILTLDSPPASSFVIARAQYFQIDNVNGAPLTLNNLAITTYKYYSPGRVRVYGYPGPCVEAQGNAGLFTPLADTVSPFQSGVQPNGNILYGEASFPEWSFSQQIIPSNSAYCIYMHNEGGGFLAPYNSAWVLWTPAYSNADVISCHGTMSGSQDLWGGIYSSYKADFHGKIEYADLGPTASPSAAPSISPTVSAAPSISAAPTTEYSTPKEITQDFISSSFYTGRGNMFDVLTTRDLSISGISIHLANSETHNIEIWTRIGSHVDNKNNWDGGWTKRFDGQVQGRGYKVLTNTIQFSSPFEVAAGVKSAIAIIAPQTTRLYVHTGTRNKNAVATSNEEVYVFEASYLSDYYSDMVGPTAASLSSYSRIVPMKLDYTVRNNGNYIPYTPADVFVPAPDMAEPDEEPICVGDDCDTTGEGDLFMDSPLEDSPIIVPVYDEQYRFVLQGVEFGCADISMENNELCGLTHEGVKVSDACKSACKDYENTV